MSVEVSGVQVGAIADPHGLAAVIEIGDPDALLASGGVIVPMPTDLVGSPTADEPAASTQVLVVRRAQFQRLFVAVRVGGDGIAWTDTQLRQALSSAVRGVVRRLARMGVTGRPLSATTAPAAVAWSVDGRPDTGAAEVDERWDHVRIGDAFQVTVRIGNTADRLSADLLGPTAPRSGRGRGVGGRRGSAAAAPRARPLRPRSPVRSHPRWRPVRAR